MNIKLLLALCALTGSLFAEPSLIEEDRTALDIGRAILTVDRALAYTLPEAPSPEETAKSEQLTKEMVKAGQITRLYPWVSSRIRLEITLAQSAIRDTSPDEARTRQLNARIKYLQRVSYLIDAPR